LKTQQFFLKVINGLPADVAQQPMQAEFLATLTDK
jgi:hypothetical protein